MSVVAAGLPPPRRVLVPRVAAATLVGAAAVFSVAAWSWPQSSMLNSAGLILLIVVPLFSGAVAVWRGVQLAGRARQAWTLLGAGAIAWAVGEAIFTWYEVVWSSESPFPGLADVGFLAGSVLLVAGVWRYPTRPLDRLSWRRSGLDSGLLMVSTFLVGWAASIERAFDASDPDLFTAIVSLAYPSGDVLIIGVLLFLVRRRPSGGREPLVMLLVGVAMLVIADTAYALLAVDDPGSTAVWYDPGWWAGLGMVGAAAAAYRPGDYGGSAEAGARRSVLLPYLAAVAALAVVPIHWVAGGVIDPLEMGLAGLVVLLLMARQLVLVLDSLQLASEMRSLSLHDPLTGLANRALLADRIRVALDRRTRGNAALLYIDLDDFKAINDVYGHAVGDRYLVEVANRLSRSARPADTVARLGGDEFAVLLSDGRPLPDDLPHIVQRFVDALAQPVELDGITMPGGASVGWDTVGHCDAFPDVEGLMRNADLAMYVAKRSGKHQAVAFEPSMNTDALHRLV